VRWRITRRLSGRRAFKIIRLFCSISKHDVPTTTDPARTRWTPFHCTRRRRPSGRGGMGDGRLYLLGQRSFLGSFRPILRKRVRFEIAWFHVHEHIFPVHNYRPMVLIILYRVPPPPPPRALSTIIY